MEVVNRVGVDINRIILHKHAAAPLQLVTGLGPRKALALMQAITRKVRAAAFFVLANDVGS